MITAVFSFLLGALGLVASGSVAYLLMLLLAAASRRPTPPVSEDRIHEGADAPRITVVIPAHDEELVLAATLKSLAEQTYPAERFQVVVVADNCTDRTAAIAQEHGARVLERVNREQRGKGYALDWAFTLLLGEPDPAEAFVIVDADTWVAADFLTLMARRLRLELARGPLVALQGRYGVLNGGDGWRAALMAGAFDLFNHVKPLGRDRLGLTVGSPRPAPGRGSRP